VRHSAGCIKSAPPYICWPHCPREGQSSKYEYMPSLYLHGIGGRCLRGATSRFQSRRTVFSNERPSPSLCSQDRVDTGDWQLCFRCQFVLAGCNCLNAFGLAHSMINDRGLAFGGMMPTAQSSIKSSTYASPSRRCTGGCPGCLEGWFGRRIKGTVACPRKHTMSFRQRPEGPKPMRPCLVWKNARPVHIRLTSAMNRLAFGGLFVFPSESAPGSFIFFNAGLRYR
jgi:hypothetical protein